MVECGRNSIRLSSLCQFAKVSTQFNLLSTFDFDMCVPTGIFPSVTGPPATTVAVAPGNPRADLHKELGDLGL